MDQSHMGGRATIGPADARPLPQGSIEQTMMQLSAQDSAAPRTAVLDFSWIYRTQPPDNANHLPRIVFVVWGSAKGPMRGVADLRHGMRVVLAGSALQLAARMDFEDQDSPFGPELDVYTSIGDGDIGRGPGLTFTTREQAGGVVPISPPINFTTIPRFAKAVEIQSNANPNAAVLNTFTAFFLRGKGAGGTISAFNLERTPVTIPNGTESIQIANLGPAAQNYRLVFHLEL